MSNEVELPPRGGAWSASQTAPSREIIDRAVAATIEHPLAQDALRFVWFHATVMLEPKHFLSRSKSAEIQAAVDLLGDCPNVLLVTYRTSNTNPEPLAGSGQTFDFVIHPVRYEILATSTGTWRS